MQRGNINRQLLESDNHLWSTPHVLQAIERSELRWDEFYRLLIQDLAFGMTGEKWVLQLVSEGNIGLAKRLSEHLHLEGKFRSRIVSEERDWLQLVEVARAEGYEYFLQQAEEISDDEKEQFEDLQGQAERYVQNYAFGDALSALELGFASVKSSVDRRRTTAAAIFAVADSELSRVRASFAAVTPNRFPGGAKDYDRAKRLLLIADDCLYRKDYESARMTAGWVQQLCKGEGVPEESVSELLMQRSLDQPLMTFRPIESEPQELATEKNNPICFEKSWRSEDDDYLIENYDVLNNDQLVHWFDTTREEIDRRIGHLGLIGERGTGKRVPWKNPYVAGKPLRSKQVFVGREDVFSFVADNMKARLDNEDGNLIVLLGHRRTGKTSVLLQLRKNRRELLSPRLPVFIDMEGLLPFPGGLRNFFWKLACRVQEELQEEVFLPRPVEENFKDPAWTFQEFLQSTRVALDGRGLVLLLDEFHAIDPARSVLDINVYKMLRSIIQHNNDVDFILAGTMEMESLMRNYEAALFGSAISKKIDFLDEQDARKLIVRPVQNHIQYSQEAVDLIVDVTASHPYFVQLVCWTLMQYLIERGKSKVSVSDVDKILPLTLERGVHFDEIWATDTSELERYVMAVIGELTPSRNTWCAVGKIIDRLRQENQMPTNRDELDEAFANLTKRRILRRSENGLQVQFQVFVFGSWVNTNKPFEVVRRDIRADAAAIRRRQERQPMAG